MNVTETLLIYAVAPNNPSDISCSFFLSILSSFFPKKKQKKTTKYILSHSSTKHLSNFIFRNDIEILGAAVIFLTLTQLSFYLNRGFAFDHVARLSHQIKVSVY